MPLVLNRKKERGFTLVETILAMIIISALVAATGHLLVQGLDSYVLIEDRREALQGTRMAANMMANELQSIADPSTDITAISATSISFAGSSGAITYTISGSDLTRTDGSGTSTLADNVTAGSGFQYYTSGGATTTNPAQVYRVGIVLGVQAENSVSGTVVIRSNVYLRNRYYESFTKT